MDYTDDNLQNHELNFWLNGYRPPFFHLDYYKSFFNFLELKNKKVLDIGCGGAPISEYCGVDGINLTILDPLIDKLILNDKYKHLSNYDNISKSLFDFNGLNYEYVVCLNVVDHFNDPDYMFIDKFFSFLKEDGILWLYYDVRDINDGEHLAIDNIKLLNKLRENFEILSIDETTNPKHFNWSSIKKSIRLIAKKK